MRAREMISTHPDVQGNMSQALVRCIEECYACAQSCTACADACLAEEMAPQLRQCIRLNLDCAEVCAATGILASRRTGSNQQVLRQMLQVCAAACQVCGESASGTRGSTSTAGSAPSPAAAASRHARRRCVTSAERTPQPVGHRSAW